MYLLTSKDSFEIKGRGLAFAFEAEQIPEGIWDPNHLRGETVEINGLPFLVAGVETYAITRSPQNPYILPFAILVRSVE